MLLPINTAIFWEKKQRSIVLRYTKVEKVNESFTGFVEMPSVSAESISAAILANLSRIGVDLRKLVGQGYDGASTVAGYVSGVQKRIRKKYPQQYLCIVLPMFELGH